MKTLQILSLLTLLLACNRNEQQQAAGLSDSLSTKKADFAIPTTALPVEPLKSFPSSFVADSAIIEDTALNCVASIHFPKSSTENVLNDALMQFIQEKIDQSKPEQKSSEATSMDMWVISVSDSGNWIGILFRLQTFTEGAAHFNHEYAAFNYDPSSKKRLRFTDVFQFSNRNSKKSFCNTLNGFVNGIDSSDGFKEGLSTSDISKNLDFALSGGKLIVYPNYCCAEEGKIFAVDLESVEGNINPVIRKNIGLMN